jgi:FdhE protein
VADKFMSKWLESKTPLSKEVVEAQAELALLSEKTPAIAELATQLSDLLPALYAEPVNVDIPGITQEKAAQKLSSGVPLLRGETVKIDWPALQSRLREVVATLRRADAASALAKAIESGQLEMSTVTSLVLDGQPERVHELAEQLDLDVPLTASLLSLVLLPALAPIRAGLESLLPASAWTLGYCPVCGCFPKLGEFRGLEQTRFLRCNLCAAGWQFPRLQCPCCGNQDHHRLGYLHVEGEEGKCRANTCEGCRQYVKMVSTLGPLSPLRLLVTDVATVHLDLLAADKGYNSPI